MMPWGWVRHAQRAWNQPKIRPSFCRCWPRPSVAARVAPAREPQASNQGLYIPEALTQTKWSMRLKRNIFFDGNPWKFIDNHWCQWKSMDFHRKKCCVLTSWTFTKVHEIPWISMDFHGPFRLGSHTDQALTNIRLRFLGLGYECNGFVIIQHKCIWQWNSFVRVYDN